MRARTDTKQRMVDGAKTLMRRHGFGATSFKDVWEFTDTPRGSVYFHFPEGKQQLGFEVIRSALDTLLMWTDRAEAKSATAGEFIERLALELATFLEESGYDEGCPIAAIAIEAPSQFPELRDESSAAFATWSARIAEVLVARGMSGEDADSTAKAATAALEGGIMVSKSDRSVRALQLTASLIARALPS